MRDETRRNLRVGALTVVAVAVLAVAIFTMGNRRQLFTRHTRYVTTFNNITGLQVGAPVRLSGVDVGFVERIELPPTIKDEGYVRPPLSDQTFVPEVYP